jgi:cobalt/nickel transport system ATP-binding protein
MKKVIEVRNLTYTYPDGKRALEQVNLEVFVGENVGLIGPNGAGKTTLLLHLNGILFSPGCLTILGLEMTRKNLPLIRKKVGLVFQDPNDQLFSPTVFEDVSFGPLNLGLSPPQVAERVKVALKKVGMENCEQHSSHHLSAGEKKKIALATVLSLPCEILILDEPSSNLDPHSRRNIIKILNQLPQTKIIAGHDLELVLETCHRVVLLNKGRIIIQGAPQQILANATLMEKYGLEVPWSLKRGEK